jgi:PAS domain S-box-containing protein
MAVQRAILVIADIGGYTRFMKVHRLSLAHAQDIVTSLLEAVIDAAKPELKLAKLEGDAALFWMPYPSDDEKKMALVSERVRQVHQAFAAKRVELSDVRLCNCDSCIQSAQLKLKFVTHLGEVMLHKVKRLEELAGVDVIVVHRLLKNRVPVPEYVLMTEPVAERFSPELMKHACEQREDLEGIGETRTFYIDLSVTAPATPAPRKRSFWRRLWEAIKMNFRSIPIIAGARKPCELYRNMEQATDGMLPPPSEPWSYQRRSPPPARVRHRSSDVMTEGAWFLPSLLAALDLAGGALVVTETRDGEPRVVLHNQAALDLFDRSAEEMQTLNPVLLAAPESRRMLFERLERIARGEQIRPFEPRTEIDIVRRDGTLTTIEFTVHSFEVDGVRRTVAVSFDRTPQKRAALALAASEARFRSLVESAPDAVAILRGPSFVYLNPSGARLLGFASPEAALGTSMADILHPDDVQLAASRIREVMINKVTLAQPAEYRFRKRDGSWGVVEVLSVPIELDGQPAVLGLARDVGERKTMERRLVLAERLAAVGQLAASVAHEINNPLAYMLLGLQHLRERLDAGELDKGELGTLLGEIADGAGRVATIAADLRAFAHAEDSAELAAVDVAQVVDSALRIAASAYRHRARVVREIGEVPHVRANAARLEQVLVNLIVNAAEAIPEGARDEHELGVAVAAIGGTGVSIEIRDTGGGIASEHLERVFDPFFTTKPRGKGTGLGLAISRRLVATMGGTIGVRCCADRGVVFRVELPLAADSDRAAEHSQDRPSQPDRRLRVLVIDDEPLLRTALERFLRPRHDVVLEASARNALARLESGERYDVILCDVVMPELGGPELYRRLCEKLPELSSRVVFMTGASTESNEAEKLAQTGARLIARPFRLSEVDAAIASAAKS